MAERAGIFDLDEESGLDLSSFAPKPTAMPSPPLEAVRQATQGTPFKSREPLAAAKTLQRRRRTGRNVQFNTKVTQSCKEGYYEVTDQYGFQSIGETMERALEALRRELTTKKVSPAAGVGPREP
jgi:hypothetical protein